MPFPILLGHEGAGVVEEVGDERDDRRTGRPRRSRLARPVRRVPVLQARRSSSLLVAAARPAPCSPRVRRLAAHAGAALRNARRPRDRPRGLRGQGPRPSCRLNRRACSRAASRPARALRCGRRRCAKARRSRSSAAAASASPSSRVRGSPAPGASSPSTSPRRSSSLRATSGRPTSSTRAQATRWSRCASSPAASTTRSPPLARPRGSCRPCACVRTQASRRSSASRRPGVDLDVDLDADLFAPEGVDRRHARRRHDPARGLPVPCAGVARREHRPRTFRHAHALGSTMCQKRSTPSGETASARW